MLNKCETEKWQLNTFVALHIWNKIVSACAEKLAPGMTSVEPIDRRNMTMFYDN